jgi:hypothetical protein
MTTWFGKILELRRVMDTRGSYDRWLRSSGIIAKGEATTSIKPVRLISTWLISAYTTLFNLPAEHYHSTCTQKWISISTSIECIIAKISQVGRPVNTIHGTASNYVFLLLAVSPGVIKIWQIESVKKKIWQIESVKKNLTNRTCDRQSTERTRWGRGVGVGCIGRTRSQTLIVKVRRCGCVFVFFPSEHLQVLKFTL